MSRKTSTSRQVQRKPLQRLLALFGLAAMLGSPVAAQAQGEPREQTERARAVLDARVAHVRQALQDRAAVNELDSAPDEAAPQWANWPNWGNWNNWPNWGNWFNHR